MLTYKAIGWLMYDPGLNSHYLTRSQYPEGYMDQWGRAIFAVFNAR